MEEVRKDGKIEELTAIVADLKKEVLDITDRLDEVEEDRRRARNHLRITLTRLKKKEIEIPREGDLDEGGIKMVDKETFTADEWIHLPVSDVANDELLKITDCDRGETREPAAVVDPEKRKEITDINKQMKDLIRRRAELRKRNVVRKSKTDEETLKEKPLPQRNPRTKPRVISDVRLVSPRTPVGKGRDIGLYRDVTLENNDSASADKTNEKWATVVNRKKLLEGNRNQDRDKLKTIPKQTIG